MSQLPDLFLQGLRTDAQRVRLAGCINIRKDDNIRQGQGAGKAVQEGLCP